jgi:hypothetical protein
MRNSYEENQQTRPENTRQEGSRNQTIGIEAKGETINKHSYEKGQQVRQSPEAGAHTDGHQPISPDIQRNSQTISETQCNDQIIAEAKTERDPRSGGTARDHRDHQPPDTETRPSD